MEHKVNLVQRNDDLFPMISMVLFLIAISKQVLCNLQKSVLILKEMCSSEFQVLYLISIQKPSLFDWCLFITLIWTSRILKYIKLE